MKRKINVIILAILLCLTSLVIFLDDIKVDANPEQTELY